MGQTDFQTETVKSPEPAAAAARRAQHENPTHEKSLNQTKSPSSNSNPNSNQVENQHMSTKSKSTNPKKNLIIALVMVVAGIGTGYALYSATADKSQAVSSIVNPETPTSAESVAAGEVYGAEQGDTFTDEAEGVLVKGGVKGEGSHHILRDGGPARNVYLTSSVLDLNLFNDHHVKVWGETFQAQEAGWLMDVGRVEVVELNAQKPFEEDSQ